jgi:putative transposase
VPRRARIELEGDVHHVHARGNARMRIFLDDADHRRYLWLLGRAVERYRWRCLAYCLMVNHVHLLIEAPVVPLGRGMGYVHGEYARTFNERHERSGHVFGGRYGSVPVADDAHLWVAARYIARNPVEAGLCREPAAWRWSSHAAIVAGTAPSWLDRGRLLAYFGGVGGEPLERYAQLVNAAM